MTRPNSSPNTSSVLTPLGNTRPGSGYSSGKVPSALSTASAASTGTERRLKGRSSIFIASRRKNGTAWPSIVVSAPVGGGVGPRQGQKARSENQIVGGSQLAYRWGSQLRRRVLYRQDHTGHRAPIAGSGRNIPDPRRRHLQSGASTDLRDYSTAVLKSGATHPDGTGPMLLIKRHAS